MTTWVMPRPIAHLVGGASPRDAAGGTAGNGFSHPRQVACRLQRNGCADGERHAKARLMEIDLKRSQHASMRHGSGASGSVGTGGVAALPTIHAP